MACRLYILVVLIETTIDLAIEGDLYLRVDRGAEATNDATAKKMPAYLSIFAMAQYVHFLLEKILLMPLP